MLVLGGSPWAMRAHNPSEVLDKTCAPMGPAILSSTWAGVWRKVPEAFPHSNAALDNSVLWDGQRTEVAITQWYHCLILGTSLALSLSLYLSICVHLVEGSGTPPDLPSTSLSSDAQMASALIHHTPSSSHAGIPEPSDGWTLASLWKRISPLSWTMRTAMNFTTNMCRVFALPLEMCSGLLAPWPDAAGLLSTEVFSHASSDSPSLPPPDILFRSAAGRSSANLLMIAAGSLRWVPSSGGFGKTTCLSASTSQRQVPGHKDSAQTLISWAFILLFFDVSALRQ